MNTKSEILKDMTLDENGVQELIESGQFPVLEDLYEIIGYPTIVEFIKYYGGDTIYVPKYDKVFNFSRNKNIYKCFQQGITYNKMAKTFSLSVRQIRNIVSEQMHLHRK